MNEQTKFQDHPNADLRERLWRARKFIDECYDQPLDLAENSKQACLSRYHFRGTATVMKDNSGNWFSLGQETQAEAVS